VITNPSSGTAAAEVPRKSSSGSVTDPAKSATAASSSSASRRAVSTRSDENSPMNTRPATSSMRAKGGLATRRENSPMGRNSADVTSSSVNIAIGSAPGNAGTTRAPI
jgi:hypothetical protein